MFQQLAIVGPSPWLTGVTEARRQGDDNAVNHNHINEFQQALAVLVCQPKQLLPFDIQSFLEPALQIFYGAKHQRQRRAKFVADVAEETPFLARSSSAKASARLRSASNARALPIAFAMWRPTIGKRRGIRRPTHAADWHRRPKRRRPSVRRRHDR